MAFPREPKSFHLDVETRIEVDLTEFAFAVWATSIVIAFAGVMWPLSLSTVLSAQKQKPPQTPLTRRRNSSDSSGGLRRCDDLVGIYQSPDGSHCGRQRRRTTEKRTALFAPISCAGDFNDTTRDFSIHISQ